GSLAHLDPRPAATRAAAEGALAAPRHLDRSAGRRGQGRAWRRSLSVVAREVARVVERHGPGRDGARREPAGTHQLRAELRMVDRGDWTAIRRGRELVAEDVEAVSAVGHEATVPDAAERPGDTAGRFPERRLVADAPRGVTGAGLGGSQDRELDARR